MIKTEDYLREFLMILSIQKRVIVFSIIATTFCAILVAYLWPPTYAVEGALLLKGKKLVTSPESLEITQYQMPKLDKQDLVSEIEILKSPDVIKEVIQRLSQRGEFFISEDIRKPALNDNIRKVQESLSTLILPDSNIIRTTLFGRNPEKALAFLDELYSVYMSHRARIFTPSEAEPFYTHQIYTIKQALKQKENELSSLAKKYGTPAPDAEIANNLIIRKDLKQEINSLMSKIDVLKKEVEYLRQAGQEDMLQFFSFIDNWSINKLGESLQDLYFEKGKLLRIYASDSEIVRRIQEQIETAFMLLKREVTAYTVNKQSTIEALKEKLVKDQQLLADNKDRNLELYQQTMELEEINRDLKVLDHSYQTFFLRQQEASIDTSGIANSIFSISVIRAPYFSGKAVFPKKRQIIPLGFLVGLITGCSLAFIREYFDHSFKRPEDVSRYAGLPTVFSIPYEKLK